MGEVEELAVTTNCWRSCCGSPDTRFTRNTFGTVKTSPATKPIVERVAKVCESRFGASAADVMEAYRQSSRVLNEIVAVHLADPNMYLWP